MSFTLTTTLCAIQTFQLRTDVKHRTLACVDIKGLVNGYVSLVFIISLLDLFAHGWTFGCCGSVSWGTWFEYSKFLRKLTPVETHQSVMLIYSLCNVSKNKGRPAGFTWLNQTYHPPVTIISIYYYDTNATFSSHLGVQVHFGSQNHLASRYATDKSLSTHLLSSILYGKEQCKTQYGKH